MTKKRKKKLVAALSFAMAMTVAIPCYANSLQDQIVQVSADTEDAEITLANSQERIASLEAKKGDMEAYLTELSKQIDELNSGLEVIQEQCTLKQEEIEKTQEELDEAKELEQSQYEDMKLRIKYIYEESVGSGMLESVLSADNFSDFLNRADAVTQINEYDREMLTEYQNTVQEISSNELKIQKEYIDLTELQSTYISQQQEVQSVYKAAQQELEACKTQLSSSTSEKQALLAKIESGSAQLSELLGQQQTAQQQAEEEYAAAQQEQQTVNASVQESVQIVSKGAPMVERDYSTANTQSSADTQASADAQASSDTQETSQAEQAPAQEQAVSTTYLGNFTLTAYCSCSICCGTWSSNQGMTASGAIAEEGVTVAMGGVAFGTQLVINGHTYTVQDRGTSYGHVDIYFSSHEAALSFGMQNADVYMVN